MLLLLPTAGALTRSAAASDARLTPSHLLAVLLRLPTTIRCHRKRNEFPKQKWHWERGQWRGCGLTC